MSKKIDEITTASGGSVAGGAFGPAGYGVVHKGKRTGNPKRPWKRLAIKKRDNKRGEMVPMETQAESILRETIRQLVFLNKVKFYEEQAKLGIQENKLRYIIRSLLAEAKSDDIIYDTTGQNVGKDAMGYFNVALQRIKELQSSEEQQRSYAKFYIDALRAAFDLADKQEALLTQSSTTGIPQTTAPAAKRADVDEQEGEEAETPEIDTAGEEMETPAPAMDEKEKEKLIQQAMQKTAEASIAGVEANMGDMKDKTGIDFARKDVETAIPQVLALYPPLSGETISVTDKKGQARQTTDKKDFKDFVLGNLELQFDSAIKTSRLPKAAAASQTAPSPEAQQVAAAAMPEPTV